jgi:hypothetical protein
MKSVWICRACAAAAKSNGGQTKQCVAGVGCVNPPIGACAWAPPQPPEVGQNSVDWSNAAARANCCPPPGWQAALWQAMLWQTCDGQLKPECTGHCGPPTVIGPTQAGLLMVCGHPGAPCVQNIVHSNCGEGQGN